MAIKRALWSIGVGLAIVATTATPSSGESTSAASLFERAESLYRQLRSVDPNCADAASWTSLAAAFERISTDYPADPLAGDALWRLGDIHARRSETGQGAASAQAIDAYTRLTARYPTSPYAPEAYLRLGELDSTRDARAYYYRLLDRYPGSPQAAEARARLTGEAAATAATPDMTPHGNGAPVATASADGNDPARFSVETPLDEALEAQPTPASSASVEREGPFEGATLVASGNLIGVRHYSDPKHTRVVFDLDAPLQHQIGEATSPPRIFIDLIGADLSRTLPRQLQVDGSGVVAVRVAVNRPGVVRAVLDLRGESRYSVFTLANPHRLVLDVPSPQMAAQLDDARRPPPPPGGAEARQLGFGVRRIVIDPGHGGTAPGAIGRSGITEKELSLDIARRLADNLRGSGYEVLLTRDSDRTLDLEERPLYATRQAADLFVSIHINSSNNRKLAGFETYYLDLATDPGAADTASRENALAASGMGSLEATLDEIVRNANKRESRDLAQAIQDSLVLQMSKSYDDTRDLGVKHAPFVVLVGAEMPAVLVECSFLSNPDEEKRLRDPDYRQKVAAAIHIGIDDFAEKRRAVTDAR